MAEFIYNRTQNHVDRLRELRKKGYENLTTSEIEEYHGYAALGAYNCSDLNRVESAVAEIAPLLGLSLTTNTAWDAATWYATTDNMKRYLSNIVAVRDAALALDGTLEFPTLPESMDSLTWEGANAIERTLEIVYGILDAPATYAPSIGGFISTNGSITENAFFQRTDYIPLDGFATVEYKSFCHRNAASQMATWAIFDESKTWLASSDDIFGTDYYHINADGETCVYGYKQGTLSVAELLVEYPTAAYIVLSSYQYGLFKESYDADGVNRGWGGSEPYITLIPAKSVTFTPSITGYVSLTGTVSVNNYYKRTDYISLSGYSLIEYNSFCHRNASSQMGTWALFDESQTWLVSSTDVVGTDYYHIDADGYTCFFGYKHGTLLVADLLANYPTAKYIVLSTYQHSYYEESYDADGVNRGWSGGEPYITLTT